MLSTMRMLQMSHSTASVKMHLPASSMVPSSADHMSQNVTVPACLLLC